MDLLGRVAQTIPNQAARRLSHTVIGRQFKRFRYQTTKLKTVEFETLNGTATIQAPEESFYYQYLSQHDRFEYPLLCELEKGFNPSTVFWDVGTHFGTMSKTALQAGVPGGNIHAFEADSFAVKVARDNLESAGTNVIHRWVGDGSDNTLRLDDYGARHGTPDIIKIDVEGAEARVLDGLGEVLEQTKIVYVEVHPNQIGRFGDSPMDVFDALSVKSSLERMGDHRGGETSWRELGGHPNDETFLVRAR